MPLSGRQRRELAAQAHALKARITIAADELTPAAVHHVRQALASAGLLKVRIRTHDREAFQRTAEQLARAVPCELVQRIGRVVVLYRPQSGPAGGPA